MRRFLVAVSAGVALMVGAAVPAGAAPPPGGEPPANGSTATTFQLTGGALFVSAPVTADLGTTVANNDNQPFSGQLGEVFVLDDRAALNATWDATATSSNFTTGGQTGPETILATFLTYSPGPTVDRNGNATFVSGSDTVLNPGGIVMSATAGNGSNAAGWIPTITLRPTNIWVAGTYSGVISHSVS